MATGVSATAWTVEKRSGEIMEQDDAVFGETFQVLFLWGRKRLYPRYPLNAPVEFVIEDDTQAEQSEGRDISLGGMGILPPETDEIPQIGSRVRLQIVVEGVGNSFHLEGEVVHADTQNGFGVRFTNLPTELRQRLKRLLTMKATNEDKE
jgi:c-di-GMP-binding flagellar brake protein YcgR